MADKTQVNVKLPTDQKQRWKRAAKNEPQANGNLSQFIRLAVERQIQGSDGPEGLDRDSLGDLEERLESIQEWQSEFGQLVKNVAQAVDSPETNRQSRAEVYAALSDEPKHIEEIADVLAEPFDEMAVYRQLEGMIGEEVEETEIDGRPHYRRA